MNSKQKACVACARAHAQNAKFSLQVCEKNAKSLIGDEAQHIRVRLKEGLPEKCKPRRVSQCVFVPAILIKSALL